MEEASATASVEETYVAPGDGDELGVIVHATSQVSSREGASAELESYLRVRLVRVDGRWRVDELTSLGSRDLSAPIPPADPDEEEAG